MFEGEVETPGRKDLRQRKARVFKNPSTLTLRVVFSEADDIGVRVVPSLLRIGKVVPGGRCKAIEADFMDPSD